MELQLPFGPDDYADIPARDGDNLVFTFEDGGQIVLQDFYTLPIEDLPSIEVQGISLAAEDFLASFGDDTILPAAGPTAGPTASSDSGGSGAYGDDAGNMIGGVDYLGMLGRMFWAEEPGNPMTEEGLPMPEGSFEWGLITMGVGDMAYEDAQPFQYLGDYSVHPASIDFTFSSPNGSWVTNVQLSGFHAGTEIFIDGVSQGFCTGPDQVYNFTYEQLTTGAGVQLIPPLNSDLDMDITGTVTVANIGGTRDYPANFTVGVDAVADMPGEVGVEAGVELQDETKDPVQGEVKEVTVSVNVIFGDAYDTSEQQFIEVRGVPEGWQVSGHPSNWTYMGTHTLEDGTVVHRFEVTGAGIVDPATHESEVQGEITFNPGDWTSSGAQDPVTGEVRDDLGRDNNGNVHSSGDAQLSVRGTSQDNPMDPDYDPDNNIATGEWTDLPSIKIVEDTPDFLPTENGKTVENQNAGHLFGDDEEVNIIGNVGMGESPEVSYNHGHGEYSFSGLDRDTGNSDLSTLIKNLVKDNAPGTPNQDQPLGMNHAFGGNAKNTSGIEEGRDYINFDLYSDGPGDSGGDLGLTSIAWDVNNLLRGVTEGADKKGHSGVNEEGDPALYSKLSNELCTRTSGEDPITGEPYTQNVNEQGYAELKFYVDPDNPQVMYGYFYNNAGDKVIALVGVITPNYADGTASVTFAQYTPLWHPTADTGLKGEDNMQSYFQVVLTDDDGDKTYGVVQLRNLDDIPTAGSSQSAVYNEKLVDDPNSTFTNGIGGNLLNKDLDDHDSGNDGAKYTEADSGSDGWAGGGSGASGGGVVSFDIELPGGYKMVATDGTEFVKNLKPGTYTIHDESGNQLGTFTIAADGKWSFHEGTNQEIIKDFDFKVTYTVQDADGDKATADLNVGVKSSPVSAGIVGTEQVFESNRADDGSVNDTAGVAKYTIQVCDYQGNDLSGASIYEPIQITLQITPQGMLGDLNLSDLRSVPGNEGIKIISYNTATGEIVIEIAAGDTDGKVDLYIPMNDDRVGGVGGTDGPTEEYKVEITKIEGSAGNDDHYVQPGASDYPKGPDGAHQDTTIIDDGANVTWNEGTQRWDVNGYQDNRLDYSDADKQGGKVSYDHDVDAHPLDGPMFGLKSSDADNSISEGKSVNFTLTAQDPNVAGNTAYGGYLDEKVELTIELGHLTTQAADVSIKALAKIDGVSYEVVGNKVIITLDKGFDMSKLDKVGFTVTATNDNLPDGGEQFQVGITGVTGNESTYFGKEIITTITDDFKGELTLSGTPSTLEGGTLDFKLTLTTDTKITSSNTGDVKAVLSFGSDTDTATRGSDYKVDIDALKAANPNLSFRDVSGETNPATGLPYPDGSVEVTIPYNQWTNQTKSGSHDVTVKIPTSHDNQLYETDESMSVKLEYASGAEIDSYGGTGTGTIEDYGNIYIRATDGNNLDKSDNIYEDPTNFKGANPDASSVVTYEVVFQHDKGTGNGKPAGWDDAKSADGDVAASKFTFDLTVKDGSANFDSNMLDNTTDANTGDYAWATPDGIIPYGDLSTTGGKQTLMEALNEVLGDTYGYLEDGVTPKVQITGVSDDGRTLTVTVHPGADVSIPMPISIGAIDDRITDPNEDFSIVLSNIKGEGTGDYQNVVVEGNREVETIITDDHNQDSRDGFLVGIKGGSASESDGTIQLPIVLFERDENGNVISADPNNPPTQTIKVTVQLSDGTAEIDKDLVADTDANGNITVEIPGGTANWQYVYATADLKPGDEGYGLQPGDEGYVEYGHWVCISPDAQVQLKDDRLTEGDEDFSAKVVGVDGHESKVMEDGESHGGVSNGSDLTIIDDSLSENNLEGPYVSSFKAYDRVVEPVAPNTDASKIVGGGSKDVDIDGFGNQTGGSSLTLGGLVFTPVLGTIMGTGTGEQISTSEAWLQQYSSELVVDGDKLGVASDFNQQGSAVNGNEGIVVGGEFGGAITDLTISLTLTTYGGQLRYQILDADGNPVGDCTMHYLTGKEPGDVVDLPIGDLPAGYSVLVYSDGGSGWYVSGAAGKVDTGASGGTVEQINDDVVNTVLYQITMSQEVSQDTIVFLNLDTTSADYNFQFNTAADYLSGNFGLDGKVALLGDGTNGSITYADLIAKYPEMAKYPGLDENSRGYFVIIPKGSAVGEINVDITHDHDSADVIGKGGIDEGKEYVDMTITGIYGSENKFDPADPSQPKSVHDEIHDDMKGPFAHVDLDTGSHTSGQPYELNVSLEATCNEIVTVTVRVTLSDGTYKDYDVEVPVGSTTGSISIPGLSGDYFFAQVIKVVGGEARVDSDMNYKDIGGGTGGSGIVIDRFEASNIHEQTPAEIAKDGDKTTVEYTIGGSIPTNSEGNYTGGNLSFDLSVVNRETEGGDFEAGGPGSKVTVEIPKELLDACGGKFTLEITKDGVKIFGADGKEVSQQNHQITVSGDLAKALDDNLIEGDEGFTTIITGITGGTVTGNGAMADSEIIDNDKPTIIVEFVDATGKVITDGFEGGEVYVRVMLVGPNGEEVKVTEDSDFNLDINQAITDAIKGSDFVLEQGYVTVPKGSDTSNAVKVNLPEDYRNDDGLKLGIDASPADNSNNQFPASSEKPAELTIHDNINGPVVSLSAGSETVYEDGTANFWVTLSKAVEEDSTVTLKIDLVDSLNTADGLILADIDYITIGGVDYSVAQIQAAVGPNAPVYLDSNGDIIVNLPIGNGYVKGGFSVTLKDDHITEKHDVINVEVIGTDKGELLVPVKLEDGTIVEVDGSKLADFLAQNDNSSVADAATDSTKVLDTMEGPTVSLFKIDSSGTEGESVNIGIRLEGETVSETEIVLNISSGEIGDPNAMKVTDAQGNEINGCSFRYEGGKLYITLPEGYTGDLKVNIPLADNTHTGANDPLVVGLDDVTSGEAKVAGGVSYSSKFASETNTTITYTMSDGGTPSANGDATFTLSDFGSLDNLAGVSIVLNGTTYSVANGKLTWEQNGDDVIVKVVGKVGSSLAGAKVTVSFKPGADADEVANAKLNGEVDAKIVGQEVSVEVKDDSSNDSLREGPTFSVEAGASVAEGAAAVFTIDVDPKLGYDTPSEPITLTFTLSGPVGSPIIVVGNDGQNYTATGGTGGKYTVTLPQGNTLPDSIEVTVPTVADNKLGDPADVKLTLNSATGYEAGVAKDGSQSASVDVTEVSTGKLTIGMDSLSVAEGNNLVIKMSMVDADNTSQSMQIAAAMIVTLAVGADDISLFLTTEQIADVYGGSSYTSGNLTWTYDDVSGSYHVEATLPAGNVTGISIPTIGEADRTIDASQNVELKVIGVDSGDLDVDVYAGSDPLVSGQPIQVEVHDADLASLPDDVSWDLDALAGLHLINAGEEIPTGSDGVLVLGNSNANEIMGTSGDDVFYGGGGADNFKWTDSDLLNGLSTDTIKDFSIDQHDTLDLRDLITVNKHGGETLDNYLNITRDGDNAVLEIKTEAGGNVVQNIVLENMYSGVSSGADEDAMTQLIQQQILTHTNN